MPDTTKQAVANSTMQLCATKPVVPTYLSCLKRSTSNFGREGLEQLSTCMQKSGVARSGLPPLPCFHVLIVGRHSIKTERCLHVCPFQVEHIIRYILYIIYCNIYIYYIYYILYYIYILDIMYYILYIIYYILYIIHYTVYIIHYTL